MWLNRSSDGRPRSLRKALKVVEQTFRPALLTGRDLDQAAEAFGRALMEALDHDPALAADLLELPGRRLPAGGTRRPWGGPEGGAARSRRARRP